MKKKAVGFGKAGPLKRTESQVLKQMKVGNLRVKRGMVFCEYRKKKELGRSFLDSLDNKFFLVFFLFDLL